MKGTVDVISINFSFKEYRVRFIMVPLKAVSDQERMRYSYWPFFKSLFLIVGSLQNWLEHSCYCKKKNVNISLSSTIFHTIDYSFKSTVVNQACPSLNGRSLETTIKEKTFINLMSIWCWKKSFNRNWKIDSLYEMPVQSFAQLLYFMFFGLIKVIFCLAMFNESHCKSRRFKGTVQVNSASDPLFLEWYVRFITVPFKFSIDEGYRTYSS